MDELLHTIDARTENGRLYRLRVYRAWVRTESVDGVRERETGVIRILGPAGESVDHVGKGMYDVLTNEGIVRVTSPESDAC